ncbi:MAG: HAD-IA family hydrolase [Litoreibacter sp.]
MAGLKLAIFDVDGTLIDSLAHIKGAMHDAFVACDLAAPTEREVRGIIGLSLFEAVDRLYPGLEEARVDAVVEAYKASFMKTRETQTTDATAPLFPGARAILEQLQSRDTLLLAVATGKSRRGLVKMLEAHALEGVFVSTQVADDHPSKPNPSMVRQCLLETGVEAHDAVMIGDTTFDLEMGRSAGVKTVGVDWGYHDTDALRPFADEIIFEFDTLPGALDKLWGDR